MRCPNSSRQAGSKRGSNSSFLCLCSLGALMNCMMPTHRGRQICFTESTDSNGNLIWKHPHRHSEIIFHLVTHGSVKLAHQLTITKHQVERAGKCCNVPLLLSFLTYKMGEVIPGQMMRPIGPLHCEVS